MERWQQIEYLFQEALQRNPPERDAWLQRACLGDTGLQVVQIADALEYAHDRGVIHRDLNPANVKVTPSSQLFSGERGLRKRIASIEASLAA